MRNKLKCIALSISMLVSINANANVICGIPLPEVETPDNGYMDYIIDKNGEYYSCWDGDPLTTTRIPIFDYDHNYGLVCIIGNIIVPEVEYDDAWRAFSAIGNCSILSVACDIHQYWNSDINSCEDCDINSVGDVMQINNEYGIYGGHKYQSCTCALDMWRDASGQCKQCPAPGGTNTPGADAITKCILKSGDTYIDDTGTYTMMDDCPWQS